MTFAYTKRSQCIDMRFVEFNIRFCRHISSVEAINSMYMNAIMGIEANKGDV